MTVLVPASEPDEAQRGRAEKRAWLAGHDYKVVAVEAADVEHDVKAVLDRLAAALG